MIDLLFTGLIIIISTAVSAIVVVLAVYYLITKQRSSKIKKENTKFSLNDQKEIQ
jgi:uncharacterized membrane protein